MNYLFGIGIPVLLIFLSGYIIWRSTDGFETAANYLGRNLSHGIKGATINAIASSMPEFLATLFFLFYITNEGEFTDSFSGGIGITAGSAVFNILIIPIAVLFWVRFSDKTAYIPLDKKLLKRDGLYLVLANIVMLFIIRQKRIDALDGIILVSIYIIYLLILWNIQAKKDTRKRPYEATVFPKHKLNLKTLLRIDLITWILGGKNVNVRSAWLLLLSSIAVMCIGTWLLVEGTELLGRADYEFLGIKNLRGINIPIIFISVLLSAAASSIPDTMISMRDARNGSFEDAISNPLGSNIFDISFAIGFPLLIYTLVYGPVEMSFEVRKWSLTLWFVLFLINLFVIPLFIHSRSFGRKQGIILIAVFSLFIIFVVGESAKFEWFSRVIEKFMQ